MELKAIWAQGRGGVIGYQGRLPWHLPPDLAHFKAQTLGCPVIMGRKTWDSLPPRFRPLPNRLNLVVTRQTNWQHPGAQALVSLEQGLRVCREQGATTAWVIGGAQLFAQALPLITEAVVTEIDADFVGDAYAPPLGPQWREYSRQAHHTPEGLGYSFVRYRNTHSGS